MAEIRKWRDLEDDTAKEAAKKELLELKERHKSKGSLTIKDLTERIERIEKLLGLG